MMWARSRFAATAAPSSRSTTGFTASISTAAVSISFSSSMQNSRERG
jgi:hypothetical protein